MKCSQTHAILAHLKRGHSLTPMEALRRFGCLRLAARCADLREAGYRIRSRMVSVGDKKVARYWLA